MNRIIWASKRAKLLRLLNARIPSKPFSNLPNLSVETDSPATLTPSSDAPESTKSKDEALATQIAGLLQTPDDGWSSGELHNLLLSQSQPSPNLLLQVIRRLGSTSKALRFFQWLRSDSQPATDPSSLASAFQGIVELASREPDLQKRFLELLAMSKEHNVTLTSDSATILLRSLGHAGMVEEAFNVYNGLDPSLKNTRICNVFVRVLLRLGNFEDARRVLDEMLEPNVEFAPNEVTGNIFFDAMLKLDKLGRGVTEGIVVALISKFAEHSIFPNSTQLTSLIARLCRSKKIGSAWDVLHAVLHSGGPVGSRSCNALLTGLQKDRDFQRMNLLLQEMKEWNILPDVVTFGILINHLCKHRRIDEALEVFEKMNGGEGSNGVTVQPDAITYNTLIDGLCKVGRQEEGLDLMRKMRSQDGCSPNTVTYNCLIDGFCKSGEIDRSWELFNKMKEEGVSPNVVTLNSMVDGMCRHGRTHSAIEFSKEMQGNGLKGNAITYTLLIKAFCNANNISKAKELFDDMLKAGCSGDAIVYYTMISGLAQAGKLDDAINIVSEMKKVGFCMDTVCYNELISAFCKQNKLDRAYQLLKEMEQFTVKRDSVTYNTIIAFLSKSGDFGTAHKVLKKMIKEGFTPTVVTYGALIHAYCTNGNINEAMKIFREMSSKSKAPPNTVIYNILINSLCKINDVDTAISLLDDMKKKAVKCNTATYNAIFKGLQATNWLDKAFELMNRMSEEACQPDYITMEILTEWLSAVGETEKLKSFLKGYEITSTA